MFDCFSVRIAFCRRTSTANGSGISLAGLLRLIFCFVKQTRMSSQVRATRSWSEMFFASSKEHQDRHLPTLIRPVATLCFNSFCTGRVSCAACTLWLTWQGTSVLSIRPELTSRQNWKGLK